jgi:hypothetical protein
MRLEVCSLSCAFLTSHVAYSPLTPCLTSQVKACTCPTGSCSTPMRLVHSTLGCVDSPSAMRMTSSLLLPRWGGMVTLSHPILPPTRQHPMSLQTVTCTPTPPTPLPPVPRPPPPPPPAHHKVLGCLDNCSSWGPHILSGLRWMNNRYHNLNNDIKFSFRGVTHSANRDDHTLWVVQVNRVSGRAG